MLNNLFSGKGITNIDKSSSIHSDFDSKDGDEITK